MLVVQMLNYCRKCGLLEDGDLFFSEDTLQPERCSTYYDPPHHPDSTSYDQPPLQRQKQEYC